MCDKNLIQLLNLDFSLLNDEFNWINNTGNAIDTVNGELILRPDSASSNFRRSIGVVDPNNNKIQVKSKLKVTRPQSSNDDISCVVFGVFVGSLLLEEFSIYIEDISPGTSVEYYIDRVYSYSNLTGSASLSIKTPEGFNNEINLNYLEVENFFFCEDSVKAYFAIEDFFDNSLNSQKSLIQLREWKVDGIETLTSDFFADNANNGSDPNNEWFKAIASIDGRIRESENTSPNVLNPFAKEFGLQFENISGNYYGGKATGTQNGNDYGQEILSIGTDRPTILNRSLNPRKSPFFLTIDFSKDLLISFDIVINDNNQDVFNSPTSYRRYFITFNKSQCLCQFYYLDVLNKNQRSDVYDDGFLSGLTGFEVPDNTIGCNDTFSFSGNNGEFEFEIDFGTDIGQAGINYDAFGVPDKFDIEWNGQFFTSGYVGSNSSDQQLLNLGVPPSEINTGNPSTGNGFLLFNKDQATPTKALVRVTAPFSGTGWNISGVCPGIIQPTEPNWVRLTNTLTINQDNTDQNNVRTRVIGNDVEFDKDLTGIDEINALFNYELKQKGDGISILSIVKNGQEIEIDRVDTTTVSEKTGVYTLNLKAGDTVTVKKTLIYTVAPSTPNGGLIGTSRNSVQIVRGNYDPFDMLNWGSILSVGISFV